MKRDNNNHRRALEKIAASPGKFGFEDVVSVSIETKLYHNHRIIAEPDIILETSCREIHIIEYKSNGDKELWERAKQQLENAKWWYERHRSDLDPNNIRTYIISGDDPRYKSLLR